MDKLDLADLRNELDKIDNNIIELLSKRFEVTKKVAIFKNKNNMEIFQSEREKKLIEMKLMVGKKIDLDEEFIYKLFQLIMDESKLKQVIVIKETNKK